MWMEQLDEDVRGHNASDKRIPSDHMLKDQHDDCSANYAKRDGESAYD